MNFKEKLQSVFAKLGLSQKAKDNTLTSEEWQRVVNAYKQEYKTTLQDDLNADQSPADNAPLPSQEEVASLYNCLLGTMQVASPEDNAENNAQNANDNENAPAQSAPTMDQVINLAFKLSSVVSQMSAKAVPDIPTASVQSHSAVAFMGNADTTKFLFGIDNPVFGMDKRWNKITTNVGYAALSAPTTGDEKDFGQAVVSYSSSLADRFKYLHEHQMLNAEKLSQAAFSNSYDGVTGVTGGNQYIVMRQDALIARVLQKRDLTQYFPVRYGIQDRDLVFNAFFTEVSQAYQKGEMFKGSMKIENEMGYVDDAMIKMQFGPMKEIERMYIAYLNKEGSDPIKWSMIEFCVLSTLETAQVEQNKRRMRGIYLKPETGKVGSYLNGSTGVLYTLIRLYHENKLLLNNDDDFNSYTATTMLDAVQAFYGDVLSKMSEDMDLDSHVLYLNKTHQNWWIKNIRTKYGKDIDFKGPDSYLNVIPDTNMHIVWLPYLGQMPFMMMQIPGNIQFLEFVPGEMMAYKIQEFMELVNLWSTWKEGCSPAFVGRQFSSKSALENNNYEYQQIFMNKPAINLVADATTAAAANGFWFITAANTAATAITDITGAKEGVAYILECGSTTNKSTVAKSDKFANISEAYTPTAVGDYLMVALGDDSKFRELERCVGGVRTINAAVQPNVPGVR